MFVHDKLVHDAALQLIAAGVNDCEISRRLDIPRTTVRDWRRPRYERRALPRQLFIDACGLVGVECRHSRRSVRIYRRASVALMLEPIGSKN